jgi:hypothetical protein
MAEYGFDGMEKPKRTDITPVKVSQAAAFLSAGDEIPDKLRETLNPAQLKMARAMAEKWK